MKILMSILALVFFLSVLAGNAQQNDLSGAWRLTSQEGSALEEGEVVFIYQDNYFIFAQYGDDGTFMMAGGGEYRPQNGAYELLYDFHSEDSSLVGQKQRYSYSLEDNSLSLEGNNASQTFRRIDDCESPLSGVWRFATRLDEEGKPGERRGPGPRQTIKVLSGERFQWAAFNNETKQLSGTGGGSYRISDGKYVETIEFFSKDDNRVGMSLDFDYEIKGDDWYHLGKSTTGNPVREIWERKR